MRASLLHPYVKRALLPRPLEQRSPQPRTGQLEELQSLGFPRTAFPPAPSPPAPSPTSTQQTQQDAQDLQTAFKDITPALIITGIAIGVATGIGSTIGSALGTFFVELFAPSKARKRS